MNINNFDRFLSIDTFTPIEVLYSPCDSLIGYIPDMTIEDAEILAREAKTSDIYKESPEYLYYGVVNEISKKNRTFLNLYKKTDRCKRKVKMK